MEAKDVEKAEKSESMVTVTCTASNLLLMLTIGAVVSGILFGFIISPLNPSPQVAIF
ncbi:hypothetical protein KIN20_010731 [Parelaphostrongylus tenuis]|uniref:Uncharacterized protein n=1 Tax=Parelaphostrongylus tenuis TaxID=148309 RepID=A0AAD5QPC5_PARTN|nr:hypothetical protein KIN20_010723 [Parelaphostrongylus tenuis]KAJ1353951.1 hypothetical protein KIN20_010731 [Parelaphostrongylus tenuis]